MTVFLYRITFSGLYWPLTMADVWPHQRDLALDPTHMVWKFVHTDPNSVTLLCALEGHQISQVDLHISLLPALACFDVEYWRILLLPQTMGRQDNMLRVETEQRYMQNVRLAITDSLLAAERSELQSGVGRIDLLHQWCTRTWNGFSHSKYGRGQYLESCAQENVIPYAREITKLSELSHFTILCPFTHILLRARVDKIF
jgi:hypothetical protein